MTDETDETKDNIETHDEPDEPNAVEPLDPEEAAGGEKLDQVAAGAFASGFNPDAPVRTSPPPPEAQSGVPDLTSGENDGVEAQSEFTGSVGDGESDPHPDLQTPPHTEAGQTDQPPVE